MDVNSCVVGYHTLNPPVFILPQVERGTAYYEGGSHIPCLVHTFTDADQIRSALAWVDRSLTDPTFLKVLAVDDKLREPNNCRLVVLSEDSRSTFEGWALAHKAQLVTTYGMFDHLSIDLAHHLRSIINTIADLGPPHGAINSNNIFLVGEGLKDKLKLGMCSLNPQTSDIQQFDRMVRGLDLNPFPNELDQLLQTLTNGQCLTYPVPAEQWRANNLIFAASSPLFMTATPQLQWRESSWYKIQDLSTKQKFLYAMVENELREKLKRAYPGGLDRFGRMTIKDWVASLRSIPAGHFWFPFCDALKYSFYDAQNPFAFCKFGRHLKVHKEKHGWSDEHLVYGLNWILNGFVGIVHEVLSGFGIKVGN